MLKVHTQRLGDTAILCLQGRIINGHLTTLVNVVNSQSNVRSVVLDLARVSRVDARGLGTLLELREQTQSRGIAFKLMNVTKLVRQVLDITRLDSVFEIISVQDLQSVLSADFPAKATNMTPCAQAA